MRRSDSVLCGITQEPNCNIILIDEPRRRRQPSLLGFAKPLTATVSAAAMTGVIALSFASKGSAESAATADSASEASLDEIVVTAQKRSSTVQTTPISITAVTGEALEQAGMEPGGSELSMVPTTTVEVTSESEAKKVLRLIEALDDHDDVQNVYANFDIPDAVMAAYEG